MNIEDSMTPGLTVGLGASAGGLEAFSTFFSRLPADSGLAFVLVQHLSPDHESLLTEILGRAATIPVVEAENGMRVLPNRVHVIPPDSTLTIKNGRLVVVKPAPPRADRRPIDTFFKSLAQDQGDYAVSIVLSGVGSDGSAGLAAVKENGGLTIAQAEYQDHAMAGMPESAAATGLVDYVLPVEEMAAKLIEYRDHLALVASRKDADGTRSDTAEHLATVLSVLRQKTGHDFTNYKIKTVTRRIQRRMQVLQTDTVPAYIKRLREDTSEPELLFRDLLIGVTEFFRDPDAFESLSSAIKGMLEGGDGTQKLRVWAPACSTGEEVYSLAITIRELMDAQGADMHVQIFGTDIDNRAIEFARAARYSRTAGISPERLQRWFYNDDGAFRPIQKIRGMCVFSVHDVIKDPPFSRLDLISCRNLMIYMDTDLQDRVLRTFHYALRADALLLLGISEGVREHAELFTTVDKAAHIFQRQDGDAAFPAMPISAHGAVPNREMADNARGPGDRVDRAVRQALAKHSPAFLVVDRHCNIVRYSGGEVARYLEPAPGVASLSLGSNLRKSLRLAVRTAVQSVVKSGQGLIVENVPAVIEGLDCLVNVIVEPVEDADSDNLYAVAFQEVRALVPEAPQPDPSGKLSAQTLAAEKELRTIRAQLHATITDLESANEKMNSSFAEHQSVNEELQSTNEELQTSKEEMQSINEELQTVNAEMMAKNDLLSILNNDLQNLLESTQIATIFLSEDLRIKNFTPRMADIFSLRQSDRGRPLTDIVSLIAYEDLRRDVAKVLSDMTVLERELKLLDRGASFVMRIRPYRSIERLVDGVVITFVDVTERKKAELARTVSERRFAAIVNQTNVGVAETDSDGHFLLTNAALEAMVGRSGEDFHSMRWQDLISPEDAETVVQLFASAVDEGDPLDLEYRLNRADGSSVWVHDSVSVLDDKQGGVKSVISVKLNIDDRKRGDERAALLLGELDHRVKNILAIVSSIVSQTLKSGLSPDAFTEAIKGRIEAITRAHNLLTNRGPSSVGTLHNLIDTELQPYRGRELFIDGPDIVLTPKAGLSMAMAIHELASNAAKYGSLSIPDGKLAVVWTTTTGPEPEFHLSWTETGGPVIAAAPLKRGFGTALIEKSMAFELDAVVQRSFPPEGVICTIDLPLTPAVGELRLPA